VIAMNTILVVNAASSSLKFQVVETDGSARLDRLVNGQRDGIGTRPQLRAQGADRIVLIDRSYSPNDVTDLPAALQATAY
jgi:acetate kinase